MMDADDVEFVQIGLKHRSPVWHGIQFFSWVELFLGMKPGDRAVASTYKHVGVMARRAGKRIRTHKRADGMLEIRCVK
jgi:hypothetical protein